MHNIESIFKFPSTCATVLLMEGICPKAIAKNLGHSKKIVRVDHYIDESRVSAIKLDALDTYIAKAVPEEAESCKVNDCSNVNIDISEFIS